MEAAWYEALSASVQGAVVSAAVRHQPDSRAVGAYVQRAIEKAWPEICRDRGMTPMPKPGARTIYDVAAVGANGSTFGLDPKTKDLDESRYTDGGVCSVGNLLSFLRGEGNVFAIAEVSYVSDGHDLAFRDTACLPIHILPADSLRIENLGTGQVRLDRPLLGIEGQCDWNRSTKDFVSIFASLAADHYAKVGSVAGKREAAMRRLASDPDGLFKLPNS